MTKAKTFKATSEIDVVADAQRDKPIGIRSRFGDDHTSMTLEEAAALHKALGEAIDMVTEARAPKPIDKKVTIDGFDLWLHMPINAKATPVVYFGRDRQHDIDFVLNAGQRVEGGRWNVFNRLGGCRGGRVGRYGQRAYASAGDAVAHRLGIGGKKAERFAVRVNVALMEFKAESGR